MFSGIPTHIQKIQKFPKNLEIYPHRGSWAALERPLGDLRLTFTPSTGGFWPAGHDSVAKSWQIPCGLMAETIANDLSNPNA